MVSSLYVRQTNFKIILHAQRVNRKSAQFRQKQQLEVNFIHAVIFLQRCRIACNADRCNSSAIPSVCLSICPFVTRWYPIHCEVAKTRLDF